MASKSKIIKRKDFKAENLNDKYKKEDKKMPYKWVRRWVSGYYKYVGRKRVLVRGHYTWVRIWVPSRW